MSELCLGFPVCMDESDYLKHTTVAMVTDDCVINANVTNDIKTLPITKNGYPKICLTSR